MRKVLVVALLVLATDATAFDARQAPRYPSPDLYRPNLDSIILRGSGSTGPIDGMSVAGRVLALRAQDTINVRDLPAAARCDGITDDTEAFQRAFAAAIGSGKHVYVPAGTCLVSGLTYAALPYAQQFSILGDGKTLTTLKQIGPGATKPVLTIGDARATNFTSGITIRGITFDANDRAQPAIVSYDLVRSRFEDVQVLNGSVGYLSYGGIGNTINADARGNGVGVRFTKFESKAGAGYPNLITLSGALVENATWGLDVDYGRIITCLACNIEGNGTALGAASGGVTVGANMGAEIASVGPTVGFVCRSCWFEDNRGDADVALGSGANLIDSAQFSSSPTQTTYDIHARGGIYTILNSTGAYAKTSVRDETSVKAGYIVGGFLPGFDTAKAAITQTANATNINSLITAGNGLQVTGGALKVATHTLVTAAPPTLTFCGVSPSVAGNDAAGTLTVGSGGPGGCTLVFKAPYEAAPTCTLSNRNGAPMTYTTQLDRLVILTGDTTKFDGSKIDYSCVGH